MGTPTEAYKEEGAKVWHYEQSTYGGTEVITGDINFIPFRYQGQYEDSETGLYYNRFRYYSPEEESYISQDPIGLEEGMALYNYVHDTNDWIDVFGLHKNEHLANSNHPVTNVPFDSKGYPDFKEHLHPATGRNDVQITPTGTRPGDAKAANEKVGFKETPDGYAWHHHQDHGRMQLVNEPIHRKTGHAGGFSINKVPKPSKKAPAPH